MPWLTDRRLLAAALLAWSTMALLGVVFGPSLGHDEAAFAQMLALGCEHFSLLFDDIPDRLDPADIQR